MIGAEAILRTVDGDRLHGLASEGSERRQELEVVLEPPERAIGLRGYHRRPPPGHLRPRPAIPGDIERTAYGLRSFCVAALDGDPAVLPALFAPDELTLLCSETGAELRSLGEDLITPQAQRGLLARLRARRRLLAERRGTGSLDAEETGHSNYAYAMDSVRIAYQALDLAEKGTITLPAAEPTRSRLLEVGAGAVPHAEVLAELDELIGELERLPITTTDPPGELSVDQWLVRTYLDHWREWRPIALE